MISSRSLETESTVANSPFQAGLSSIKNYFQIRIVPLPRFPFRA